MNKSYLQSLSQEGVGYLSSCKRTYIQHLAKASEIVNIRITADIVDQSEKNLFRQDELIQPGLVFRLMQIPVEILVSLFVKVEREKSLFEDFQQLIQQDLLLSAIDENHSIEKLVSQLLEMLPAYPVLEQHLSLLAIQLPKTYLRTLYCSILSLLIAKEMRLTLLDIHTIFFASLSHDLGMLFVDPLVLNKKDKLSGDDWFQIQQHLPMSVELLRSIPKFPEQAITAVSEHHERCDGTGYPAAKVESEISLLGQILGLTDSLAAIYFNRFKNEGRSLRDAAAIIQLNQQAYLHRNYELVMAVLKRGEMPLKNVINENTPALMADFAQKNQFLANWFNLLRECLLSVGFTHGDRKLHALQNVIIHVATTIRGSGIFYESNGQKIESTTQLVPHDEAMNIENLMMLQQEFLFHLQRLNRMLQLYLDSNETKNKDIETKLRNGFDKILDLLNG